MTTIRTFRSRLRAVKRGLLHLDEGGHALDPAQDEALQDSVLVLLGELEHVEVAA
jgi:hypothetical protein